VCAFSIGFAAALGPAQAQDADRVPDLNGKWFPDHCIPDGATCPFDIGALDLTPRAVKFAAEFDEAVSPKYD
jgi:hypothetical protein